MTYSTGMDIPYKGILPNSACTEASLGSFMISLILFLASSGFSGWWSIIMISSPGIERDNFNILLVISSDKNKYSLIIIDQDRKHSMIAYKLFSETCSILLYTERIQVRFKLRVRNGYKIARETDRARTQEKPIIQEPKRNTLHSIILESCRLL